MPMADSSERPLPDLWRVDEPPDRTRALVTVQDRGSAPRVREAVWHADESRWYMSGGPRWREEVSAWMSLPEPFVSQAELATMAHGTGGTK